MEWSVTNFVNGFICPRTNIQTFVGLKKFDSFFGLVQIVRDKTMKERAYRGIFVKAFKHKRINFFSLYHSICFEDFKILREW